MGGENQGGREPHLGERGGIKARAWSGKGGLHREKKADSKEDREGKQQEPP